MFDSDRQPIRFTGITQEITTQKQLIQSLQMQSLVLERMGEGVSISDENGIILLTNPAEDRMFGYDHGELVGKHISIQNAYHAQENELIVANVISELKSKGLWNGEWHNRKKNGDDFYTFSYITSLSVNGANLFVCVRRDITNEKQVKKALHYRNALLEAQNEAIPDALLVVDTKGKMLSFNRHFAKLWGMPQAIIDAKDDTAALKFAMEQVADPQQFIDRINYYYQHPDEKVHEEVKFKDGRIIERWGNAVIGEDGTNFGWIWYFRDITESKKAEHAIRQALETTQRQQRLYEAVTNNTPDLVYVFDLNYRFTYANRSLLTMWGRTADDSIGKSLRELGYEDWHAEMHEREIDQIAKTKKSIRGTVSFPHAELGNRIYDYIFAPIFNEQGEVEAIAGSTRDITDIKLAEETANESEAQLAFAIDTTELGVWDYNPHTNTLTANARLKEWFGFEPDGEIDLSLAIAVIDVGDQQRVTDAIQKALQYGAGDYDVEYAITNKKTSQRRIVRARGRATFDDNKIAYRFNGTLQDVTTQANARKRIEESEELFRILATSIPQIVWMTDAVGNLQYITRNWEQYTGQTLEKAKNGTSDLIYPDDLAQVLEAWNRSLQEKSLWKKEYRIKNNRGEYRWFSATMTPLKNEKGQIVKWIGAATDIHDQKTISEQLEKLVDERTKALQQSNEDLQQFAHVASHDLKEPVRKIKTFVGRLQTEHDDRLDEKGKTYLSKVQSATDRIFTMIDGVLKYSMLSSSVQTPELVDLNEIIRNIEMDLEVIIHQKQAKIEYNDLPTLEGDPVLLYQLFYNLINNSLKFAKLNVPPAIHISSHIVVQSNLTLARITLADNGIGFESNQAEKIFDTFTRLHSKDKYEGTGLGLALCKKIVERHDGRIEATSILDEGATFTILLPLKATNTK